MTLMNTYQHEYLFICPPNSSTRSTVVAQSIEDGLLELGLIKGEDFEVQITTYHPKATLTLEHRVVLYMTNAATINTRGFPTLLANTCVKHQAPIFLRTADNIVVCVGIPPVQQVMRYLEDTYAPVYDPNSAVSGHTINQELALAIYATMPPNPLKAAGNTSDSANVTNESDEFDLSSEGSAAQIRKALGIKNSFLKIVKVRLVGPTKVEVTFGLPTGSTQTYEYEVSRDVWSTWRRK